MAKGITGTGRGFDVPGRRLGGFSQPAPLPLLRQSALTAAERRAQRGTLMPAGPRYIGGDGSIKTALSPIQAAAMAAERRLHDDVWCGSQTLGTHGERANNNASSSMDSRMPISSVQFQPPHGKIESQDTWQCSICTLINKVKQPVNPTSFLLFGPFGAIAGVKGEIFFLPIKVGGRLFRNGPKEKGKKR